MDRPTPAQPQNMPEPSTASTSQEQYDPIPMDEGKIDSEMDQDPCLS